MRPPQQWRNPTHPEWTEAGQDIATIAYVPDTFLQQMGKDGQAELLYLRSEPQRLFRFRYRFAGSIHSFVSGESADPGE